MFVVGLVGLRPGDQLRTPIGDTITVASIITWTDHQQMLNLGINDLHTYYIIAGGTPVLVHNRPIGPLRPLIIGENVGRTQTYAAAYGGIAWTPRAPVDTSIPGVYDDLMRRNMRAIQDAMREGRKIIDIGPDFDRRARTGQVSPFYEAERRAIREADYGNYGQDFERTGKLQGGSARLGETC